MSLVCIKRFAYFLLFGLLWTCQVTEETEQQEQMLEDSIKLIAAETVDTLKPTVEVVDQEDLIRLDEISLVVLGTVQDAGSPHIGCQRDCCKDLFESVDVTRQVVSLGLVLPSEDKKYLFDATPDITKQMMLLKKHTSLGAPFLPDGIFLTHAHIGHYTGLMYLGKEALGAEKAKVYAMPRMKRFLERNGPWDQLVKQENIELTALANEEAVVLDEKVQVIPMLVPHRDEYSETVGYKIISPDKKALFIPDIDKWEKWDKDIIEEIAAVDYAFLDATFYDPSEINYRDPSEIPHPFVVESIAKFEELAEAEKNKIYFIHLNHTNPMLNLKSTQAQYIRELGFHIAQLGQIFRLE